MCPKKRGNVWAYHQNSIPVACIYPCLVRLLAKHYYLTAALCPLQNAYQTAIFNSRLSSLKLQYLVQVQCRVGHLYVKALV